MHTILLLRPVTLLRHGIPLLLVLLFISLPIGCSDTSDEATTCTQEIGVPCICPDGGLGYACPSIPTEGPACNCIYSNTETSQDTTQPPPIPGECAAEDKNTCLCDDGTPGLACPLEDGSPGECVCINDQDGDGICDEFEISIHELENNKQIIRELNLLGQTDNPNSGENIKIYIYDDGSVEKVKYIHK